MANMLTIPEFHHGKYFLELGSWKCGKIELNTGPTTQTYEDMAEITTFCGNSSDHLIVIYSYKWLDIANVTTD